MAQESRSASSMKAVEMVVLNGALSCLVDSLTFFPGCV